MADKFDAKLQLYLRSERAMLGVFLRNQSRKYLLILIGFIALFIALILCDIGVFFVLNTYLSTPKTAFVLACAHVLLFLILMIFSKIKHHQKEVAALEDIRDFAKEEVSKDLKAAKDEVLEVGSSVGHVVHDITSIFNGELLGLVCAILRKSNKK
ncbi:MAG: hypothetical protein QNK11_06975 [Legionella sp.]|nr:hypothetical protein [Legionella sp.]